MIYSEQDAPLLKAWIVKKLDNNSDADPDILADYVLALLRHEAAEEEVRKLCLTEIPDFLQSKEGNPAASAAFVNDLFECVHRKAYLPGRSLPKIRVLPAARQTAGFASAPHQMLAAESPSHLPPTTQPSRSPVSHDPTASTAPKMNMGRKRSHQDRVDGDPFLHHQPESQNRRFTKQPRRGGHAPSFYPNHHIPPTHLPDSIALPHTITSDTRPLSMPSPHLGQIPPPMPQHHHHSMHYQVHQGYEHQHHPRQPFPGHQQFNQVSPPQAPGGYPPPPQQHDSRHPTRRGGRKRCIDWDTSGFCPRQGACKFEHIFASIVPTPYDPSQPSLKTGAASSGLYHHPSLPKLEDFAVAGPALPQMGILSSRSVPTARTKNNRAPFSADGMVHDQNNMAIVVENVPGKNFNGPDIKGFFSQFGSIEDLNLLEGPKKIAIIKYDEHSSALSAYKSPKVIFDNRFVKVYWCKVADAKIMSASESGKPNEGQAHGSISSEVDMEEFLHKQAEAQKNFEERKKMKQELQEQREQVECRQKELQKERREFLEKCAAKGISIKKEDDGDDDDDDDGEITISTGDDLHQSRPTPISKEALQVKLAEVEAEARMYGIDPDDDTESVAGWAPPFRGGFRGRGRGSFRGRFGYRGAFRGGYRGRGGFFGTAVGSIHEAYARYSLDNRPRTVLLAGADLTAAQDYEALRHHLLGTGEFLSIDQASEGTSIAFKDRKTAEQFFNSIRNGQIPGIEGKLEVSWVANSSSSNSMTPASGAGRSGGPPGQSKPANDGFDVLMGGIKNEPTSEQAENPHVDYDVADDEDWDVA
ncbi:hypothetical protein MKZ38_006633 [Zalerion maritima]|uniref:Uncharacterized protein n=1 Tax=Zalerion maritima TaxID=339359 RepID=A0AAD5WQ86_9PEZI|nr:hypothetical protein MKZ38_006633 [Zalerion maritima]